MLSPAFEPLLRNLINFPWLCVLDNISPSPEFLSDVAAFEAVTIAILIPLSIEIISKLSERYNSEVIIRTFEEYWANKYLPGFLLINIVAVVILRFFAHDYVSSHIWKISALIILLFFIVIAFVVWRVIRQIRFFMHDTRFILDQLYKNVSVATE
ncbi:MAG: hypothetical protein RIB59_04780 [Rhodospirillales bacterium]